MDPKSAPSHRSVDEAIGNTPLVKLRRVVPGGSASVHVKVEGMNPGGSVKDRAARAIIGEAEATGRLDANRILLDASSGNTGIAYAMICAGRGYRCEICLPSNASLERKLLLNAYGCRIVETDPAESSDGAIREARRRAEAEPERYFYADQYNNPANVQAHLDTTAPEIWRQTEGAITHFVAILGTSGTFTGTGTGLRKRSSAIGLVAVQPDSPFHGLEGAKHMATAIVPGIYRESLADEVIEVRTEDAQAMAMRLAREEGLFAGVSGGANVVAALRVAERVGEEGVVVTVLPDGGERYLSESWVSDVG